MAKFIPYLATLTFSLGELIKNDVGFKWTPKHQETFDKMKEHMSNADTLEFYHHNQETLLIVDTSPCSLGAVLVQFEAEGLRMMSYAAKS